FQAYIETTADDAWQESIETPFFGRVSRTRLLGHVLFHTAHHAGQISLTLSRGQRFD
ncbi:MAG: DinB family protein, partial [Cytophagaceae bacterium]